MWGGYGRGNRRQPRLTPIFTYFVTERCVWVVFIQVRTAPRAMRPHRSHQNPPWHAHHETRTPEPPHGSNSWQCGLAMWTTLRVTDRYGGFLKRHVTVCVARPWFVGIGTHRPHWPWRAPPEFLARYAPASGVPAAADPHNPTAVPPMACQYDGPSKPNCVLASAALALNAIGQCLVTLSRR